MSQDPSAATLVPLPFPAIGWTKGIAPRFIAMFLLLVYYDRLAIRTLLVGGLVPSSIGVIAGGLLAFFLFFRPLALWSLQTREPMERLAARTFGVTGGALIMRLVLGLALLVWFAVVIREAVDVTSRALVAFGLIDGKYLDPQVVSGITLPGPLFLGVAAIWSVTSAIIGSLAYKLVAAVMAGYQPFVALSLTALAAWAIGTSPQFVPLGYDPVTAVTPVNPAIFSILQAIQWICAYFAIAAALGADWGMASRDRRDIRDGGATGIAIAAPVLAIIAFLFVAGTLGRNDLTSATAGPLSAHLGYQQALLGESQSTSMERDRLAALASGVDAFSVRNLILHELPGFYAGLILLIFSVGFLGPACFSPYLAGRLISGCWPHRPRWTWTLAVAFATWPLLILNVVADLGAILDLLGGIVAPILGTMVASRIKAGGTPETPRPGLDLPVLSACVMGTLVGVSPVVGPPLGLSIATQLPLAVICAYLTSFILVWILPRKTSTAQASG